MPPPDYSKRLKSQLTRLLLMRHKEYPKYANRLTFYEKTKFWQYLDEIEFKVTNAYHADGQPLRQERVYHEALSEIEKIEAILRPHKRRDMIINTVFAVALVSAGMFLKTFVVDRFM